MPKGKIQKITYERKNIFSPISPNWSIYFNFESNKPEHDLLNYGYNIPLPWSVLHLCAEYTVVDLQLDYYEPELKV